MPCDHCKCYIAEGERCLIKHYLYIDFGFPSDPGTFIHDYCAPCFKTLSGIDYEEFTKRYPDIMSEDEYDFFHGPIE